MNGPDPARSVFMLDEGWTLNGQPIRVPYPPQSAASGWKGPVPQRLRYVCVFRLPSGFPAEGRRVFLHFGAVDQTCRVSLNGEALGAHEGGYLPFRLDTRGLLRPGENTLEVLAEDSLSHLYPYGKQSKKPHGMWYTPVSGIWQNVYLESVPETHVTDVVLVPDLTGITLTVRTEGAAAVEAAVAAQDETILRLTLPAGVPARVAIPSPRLWSPEDPFLYRLTVTAGEDRVTRAFGLRTVDVRQDGNGVARLCLNGQPVFLSAPLVQGYFPDGLFAPSPKDPSFETDLKLLKRLGFNAVRMHVKVEQPAFYDACDRLGILVLQDMVQSGAYHYLLDTVLPTVGFKYRPNLPFLGSRRRKVFFERHCLDTLETLRSHPSVILYTIFNEGWGQFDPSRLYRTLKAADPSRVYVTASGWFKGFRTDLRSEHIYFRNKRLRPKGRATLLSECGGFVRTMDPGEGKTYGYGKTDTERELTARILTLYETMVLPAIPEGLCGVVYTQLYDVETERNGLYTADRQTGKADADALRSINERCREELKKHTQH